MNINYPDVRGPRVAGAIKLHEWLETGNWVAVKSTSAAAIAYDADLRRLHVQFKQGGKRQYPGNAGYYDGVPIEVAVGVYMATSIGKYLSWQVRRIGYRWRYS